MHVTSVAPFGDGDSFCFLCLKTRGCGLNFIERGVKLIRFSSLRTEMRFTGPFSMRRQRCGPYFIEYFAP